MIYLDFEEYDSFLVGSHCSIVVDVCETKTEDLAAFSSKALLEMIILSSGMLHCLMLFEGLEWSVHQDRDEK